jgi:hypothetical protein
VCQGTVRVHLGACLFICVRVYALRVRVCMHLLHGEHSSCASPCNHRSDKGIGRNCRCPELILLYGSLHPSHGIRRLQPTLCSLFTRLHRAYTHTQSCSLFLSPALTHGVPSRDRIALASAGPVHGVRRGTLSSNVQSERLTAGEAPCGC